MTNVPRGSRVVVVGGKVVVGTGGTVVVVGARVVVASPATAMVVVGDVAADVHQANRSAPNITPPVTITRSLKIGVVTARARLNAHRP